MDHYYFPPSADVLHDYLFFRLEPEYEKCQWMIHRIPWRQVRHNLVDERTVAYIRASATLKCNARADILRLHQEFVEDGDLTRWLTRRFLEETRQALALAHWLREVGVPLREPREAALPLPVQVRIPEMGLPLRTPEAGVPLRGRSPGRAIHTLAAEIIAKMTSAAWHRALTEPCEEPVLGNLLRLIVGDEARHAATLFLYTRRYLEHANDRNGERRELLKSLHAWLLDSSRRLPFAEFLPTGGSDGAAHTAEMARAFDGEEVERRIIYQFGALADVEIGDRNGVGEAIRAMGEGRHHTPE